MMSIYTTCECMCIHKLSISILINLSERLKMFQCPRELIRRCTCNFVFNMVTNKPNYGESAFYKLSTHV